MPRERGRGVRSCSLIAAFPQKQIPRRAPGPRAALLCVCDRLLFLDVDSPDVMCSCVRRGGYGKSPTRPSRRSFDRRWLRAECCSRRLPALAWLPLWRASCRQHHEVSLVTPHRLALVLPVGKAVKGRRHVQKCRRLARCQPFGWHFSSSCRHRAVVEGRRHSIARKRRAGSRGGRGGTSLLLLLRLMVDALLPPLLRVVAGDGHQQHAATRPLCSAR